MRRADFLNVWMGPLIFFLACFLSSCQTVSSSKKSRATKVSGDEAIASIAEVWAGKHLTQEEVENLKKQLKTDKDARSAIQAITGSVATKREGIKYCPVAGEHYAPHLDVCPIHKVKLKAVEE
jgi:uncharacterized small protein (DUF1192 family)